MVALLIQYGDLQSHNTERATSCFLAPVSTPPFLLGLLTFEYLSGTQSEVQT